MSQEPPAQQEMGETLPQVLCHLQGRVPSILLGGNVPSGDSPSEGGRVPKRNSPERSLPGEGRRGRRSAGGHGKGQEGTEKGTVLCRSWSLCQMSLLFPFEKGEKVEFYSFLPCRAKRLGGSNELLCSAPALGSPWSHCRHLQAQDKAPGPARGWGQGTAPAWGPHQVGSGCCSPGMR